jgi:hypothetical protein
MITELNIQLAVNDMNITQLGRPEQNVQILKLFSSNSDCGTKGIISGVPEQNRCCPVVEPAFYSVHNLIYQNIANYAILLFY